MADSLKLVDCSPEWHEELVRMWRESFEFGVGIADPHSFEEHVHYFETVVVAQNQVRLAIDGDRLVGFIAATPESIAQLYVRVGWQGRSIGSLLLNWAKSQSSGGLWLYTFARNERARRFYERHGFQAAEFGFEPNWQLDDVKYVWPAQALSFAPRRAS